MSLVLVMVILNWRTISEANKVDGQGILKNFYFGSNVMLGSDEADDGRPEWP